MIMFSSEEDFLEFLKKNHKSTNTIPKNWLGIGDDAAVIDINKTDLIFCTDAMVEDTHFRSNQDFFNVGWKSIVSNQSDIAAMGGFPLGFTVTLGINKYMNNFERVEKLMKNAYQALNNVHWLGVGGGNSKHIQEKTFCWDGPASKIANTHPPHIATHPIR